MSGRRCNVSIRVSGRGWKVAGAVKATIFILAILGQGLPAWPQSPVGFQVRPDALVVQVPAGGGCPDYAATVQQEGDTIVVLLHNRGDSCKGWFPNERRDISFSWQQLGLSSKPQQPLQVRIAP